jgi:hypothetical protein
VQHAHFDQSDKALDVGLLTGIAAIKLDFSSDDLLVRWANDALAAGAYGASGAIADHTDAA